MNKEELKKMFDKIVEIEKMYPNKFGAKNNEIKALQSTRVEKIIKILDEKEGK